WPVSFEAGTLDIRRDLTAQAERLATFLRDAPGIALSMKPVVSGGDTSALARAAVRQRIDGLVRDSGQPAEAVAARLYAERFPCPPAPATLDATVDELAKGAPAADAAIQDLANARVNLLRRDLESRGIDASRLVPSTGVVPVEASGQGRV